MTLGGYQLLQFYAECNEDLLDDDHDGFYVDGWNYRTSKFPSTQNVVSQRIISKFFDMVATHALETGHAVLVKGERE